MFIVRWVSTMKERDTKKVSGGKGGGRRGFEMRNEAKPLNQFSFAVQALHESGPLNPLHTHILF